MDDVFEYILRTSVMLTRAEAATIRVFDINTGKLKIVKGFGVSSGFLSQPPIRLGEGITGRVVLEGKPFSTDDVMKVPYCVHKELARLEGIRAIMSVPLKTREDTIGCITVYRKKAESFAEHDLLLLSIFASEVVEAVEKTRLIEELKKQATFDLLTGVYNKNTLIRELDSKMRLALRHGYDTSIIFIDIDNFKNFNDTYGHLLGDKLLCDLVRVLKLHCRKTDVIGRFGGEEFVVIAPHTDKNEALIFANKLREIVCHHKFAGKDNDVDITISAGVSSIPEDGLDVTDILKKADDAMYRSKLEGKNRVTVWADEK
ncbi:MAG: sensor domain-containing diguanylate cyclase [Thermodesulfovibrionales bacterium]|nr:sensor domain-containing diguanylate cyclase [Thermodesulfovibrionales bacterium]